MKFSRSLNQTTAPVAEATESCAMGMIPSCKHVVRDFAQKPSTLGLSFRFSKQGVSHERAGIVRFRQAPCGSAKLLVWPGSTKLRPSHGLVQPRKETVRDCAGDVRVGKAMV